MHHCTVNNSGNLFINGAGPYAFYRTLVFLSLTRITTTFFSPPLAALSLSLWTLFSLRYMFHYHSKQQSLHFLLLPHLCLTLSLSSSIAIPNSKPKTKPLSPIHHKTLAREGLAMQNGSNSVSFCI
jgi:hypothetical protein